MNTPSVHHRQPIFVFVESHHKYCDMYYSSTSQATHTGRDHQEVDNEGGTLGGGGEQTGADPYLCICVTARFVFPFLLYSYLCLYLYLYPCHHGGDNDGGREAEMNKQGGRALHARQLHLSGNCLDGATWLYLYLFW